MRCVQLLKAGEPAVPVCPNGRLKSAREERFIVGAGAATPSLGCCGWILIEIGEVALHQ